MDLWQLAETRTIQNQRLTDKTLLILGERKSGKSSILQSFLSHGKEEAPKTTVALEYAFARAPIGVSAKRDVGHIYELGGGRLLSSLVGVAVSLESITGLNVVISLDLSAPHKVLDSLLFWLQITKDAARRSFSQLEAQNPKLAAKVRTKVERNFRGHEDLSQIDLPPIPLTIIANKWDVFQQEESEKRKWMSRALRYFAHKNGASLLYLSQRDTRTVSAMRSTLNHYVFGLSMKKVNQVEYNAAVMVSAGADTFAQQGPPPGLQGEVANVDDQWVQAFNQLFPKT